MLSLQEAHGLLMVVQRRTGRHDQVITFLEEANPCQQGTDTSSGKEVGDLGVGHPETPELLQ